MKWKITISVFVLLVVFGSLWATHSGGSSEAARQIPAPCSIIVPSNAGESVGSSGGGMDFKERATLRFVSQLACGSEAPPNKPVLISNK